MRRRIDIVIEKYDFKSTPIENLNAFHFAKNFWPIVYILSNKRNTEAYIGETINALFRLSIHLKNDAKKQLSLAHLIASETFNKSVTLDLEAKLIKYIAGDGQFRLLNANLGLTNHNYYQKNAHYKGLFNDVWARLIKLNISKFTIKQIDNSDLFKYSPYKTLSEDQKEGLRSIILSLLERKHKQVIIEGGAGTGKTILAVFLFKLLHTATEAFNFRYFDEDDFEFLQLVKMLQEKYKNPKMALVIPVSSFRNTLKKVFQKVEGLNANMVIGPADIAKGDYDLVLVDESHRLRRRVNLGSYFGGFDKICAKLGLDKNKSNELDWVIQKSRRTVLFYDENQSVKPSDIKKEVFDKLKRNKSTGKVKLISQFRVLGGNDYIDYIDKLLSCSFITSDKKKTFKGYEFLLFDNIKAFQKEIKVRNDRNGLSRLIAGYSWKWASKKNKKAHDILIDGRKLKWNGVLTDWVNSPNAINEVGCIHTTQGYDLNYAGVIFGKEISYDKEKNKIVIQKENYHDQNGKNSIEDPAELKVYIINIYKTMMLRGIMGTFVYVCDEELRKYFAKYIEGL